MTDKMDIVGNFKAQLAARERDTEQLSFQFGDAKVRRAGEDKIITISDDEYKLSDNAARQLAKSLEIPVPFSNKIDDQLFEINFNHLLKNNKTEFKNALVVGDRIRSLGDAGNPYVSSAKVFETLEETFDGDYDLKYLKLDDSVMSFSMLPSVYKTAIDGAKIFGGLKVKYSDAWEVFPEIDAYIWREICTNGMINNLDGHKFRVSGKNEDQILTQFSTFATESLAMIPELYENFTNLLKEKVTDPKSLVRRICVEYKLPNKIRERLLFWLEQVEFLATISGGEVTNMHDIVNLVTWAGSNDADLSMDNRNLLMSIAGKITLAHSERCSSCGVVVG